MKEQSVRFTALEIANAQAALDESESAILDANMSLHPGSKLIATVEIVVNEETEPILKKLGKLTAGNCPSANTENPLSKEPPSRSRQQKSIPFESQSEQKEIEKALSGFDPYPD